MSISIGLKVIKVAMASEFTEHDLISEVGISRHAALAWRQGLEEEKMIVSCGVRNTGGSGTKPTLWKFVWTPNGHTTP